MSVCVACLLVAYSGSIQPWHDGLSKPFKALIGRFLRAKLLCRRKALDHWMVMGVLDFFKNPLFSVVGNFIIAS